MDARVPQEEIAHLYNRTAPVYDIWARLTESKARTRAIELAEIKDGQDILEIAVGTGTAFYEIVTRNPNGRNVGIDISQGMLDRARKKLSGLPNERYSFSIGSAYDLDFPDESFDTLMNSYMMDLIPFNDIDGVINEFKRVLRKGGRLVLVNMTKGKRFGSGIYERIHRLSPRLMGGCRGIELSDTLARFGFEVKLREYVQQTLFPSEVVLAFK